MEGDKRKEGRRGKRKGEEGKGRKREKEGRRGRRKGEEGERERE